jgi:hypothetical protein
MYFYFPSKGQRENAAVATSAALPTRMPHTPVARALLLARRSRKEQLLG